MKKYWCVKSKFFDGGTVRTWIYEVNAKEKPQNEQVENKMCDEYRDYFNTYEEAKQFELETKKEHNECKH